MRLQIKTWFFFSKVRQSCVNLDCRLDKNRITAPFLLFHHSPVLSDISAREVEYTLSNLSIASSVSYPRCVAFDSPKVVAVVTLAVPLVLFPFPGSSHSRRTTLMYLKGICTDCWCGFYSKSLSVSTMAGWCSQHRTFRTNVLTEQQISGCSTAANEPISVMWPMLALSWVSHSFACYTARQNINFIDVNMTGER